MITTTLSHLASVVLLAILAAVLVVAASVLRDAAEGFCPQLDPCHTEEVPEP